MNVFCKNDPGTTSQTASCGAWSLNRCRVVDPWPQTFKPQPPNPKFQHSKSKTQNTKSQPKNPTPNPETQADCVGARRLISHPSTTPPPPPQPTFFILEEFHGFAAHARQSLIYNLLDMTQQPRMQVSVWFEGECFQGYLTYKKTQPPRTLP